MVNGLREHWVTWTVWAFEEKPSIAGGPGTILKFELLLPDRPLELAVKVYPVPDLSIFNPENADTPPVAATDAVPERVPPPGLIPIATVIEALELVT